MSLRGLISLLLVGALGCGSEPSVNVVIILIDTLRADHLGSYGHPRVQTPTIDSLARQGVLFERAFTVVPTTLASTASIFTGQSPRTHGVPRNNFHLSDASVTLAERLRESGYDTAAFVGAFVLAPYTNISQGFDLYDGDYQLFGARRTPQRRGRAVTNAVLSWLEERERGPYFLFVHYFDVHFPYEPLPPYDSLYTTGYTGPVDGTIGSLKTLRADLLDQQDRTSEIAHVRSLYLGEITYVDQEIARLLRGLREHGDLERTLLVLLADHGETFEEHAGDYFNHGQGVYDTTLRIPLIVRMPGAQHAGARVSSMVRTIDLAPTIYEILGIRAPEGIEGRSFERLLEGGVEEGERVVFAEATKPYEQEPVSGWRNAIKAKCVRTGEWKYVWVPYLNGREELFDLRVDPGERDDLLLSADRSPATAGASRELRAMMEEFAGASARRDEWLGEETSEALRALGYFD